MLENALLAGKHKEFHTLSNELQRPNEQVRANVISFVKRTNPDAFQGIIDKIGEALQTDL